MSGVTCGGQQGCLRERPVCPRALLGRGGRRSHGSFRHPRPARTSSTRPPIWSSPIVISACTQAHICGSAQRHQQSAHASSGSPAAMTAAGVQVRGSTQQAAPRRRTVRSPLVHAGLHDAGADKVSGLAALCQHLLLLLRVRHAARLLRRPGEGSGMGGGLARVAQGRLERSLHKPQMGAGFAAAAPQTLTGSPAARPPA